MSLFGGKKKGGEKWELERLFPPYMDGKRDRKQRKVEVRLGLFLLPPSFFLIAFFVCGFVFHYVLCVGYDSLSHSHCLTRLAPL